MRQRIFIGSSKEGLYVAERIKEFFQDSYDCFIWTDEIFKYNEGFLETLIKSASLFDFGFMVFSADDFSKIRGKEYDTVRDNILFEYGLFLGRLGIDNAYILCEEGVKIPSDVLGITLPIYTTHLSDGKKELDELFEVLLIKLKKQIDEKAKLAHLGLLPSTVMAVSYFENFVKSVADYLFYNKENIVVKDKKYKSAKFQIVIPNELNDDIKRTASYYFNSKGYMSSELPCQHRSYPIHVVLSEDNEDSITIIDMPTTLNGISKSISLYFRNGCIGKTVEQKLTEEREINNFVRVLKILIMGDSYCRDIVEVVNEDGIAFN